MSQPNYNRAFVAIHLKNCQTDLCGSAGLARARWHLNNEPRALNLQLVRRDICDWKLIVFQRLVTRRQSAESLPPKQNLKALPGT